MSAKPIKQSPASRDLPERILEQQNTATVVIDLQGDVRYLNPAAEALLETSHSQALGASLNDLLVSDASLPVPNDKLPLHATTTREATFWLRNGRQMVSDCTTTPLPEGDGLLLELVPLTRLVRIQNEDQSSTSTATTKQLVRGFAHEVRNPLGGIRGAAQLLQRTLASDEQREYTTVIINEVDRLSDLVNRMLGPKTAPKLLPTNVHRVLQQATRVLEAEADLNITLARDYDPSLPKVLADAAQLQQAILNVLLNAKQALANIDNPAIRISTRGVRQFTIGARRHRLALRISITDNGPGIPEDLRAHMFYPMVSGRAEGSGLGLSIAQSILAEHNGLLDCHSQPGQTTFNFYLPLELSNDH